MRVFIIVIVCVLAFACKDKKSSLTGNQQIDLKDFYDAYPELKLPFTVSDTTMKKVADTAVVSYAVFAQFIPDTLLMPVFGKDKKLVIQPIGKIEVKDKETYLATLVSSKSKSAIYLLVFDKGQYKVNLPLLISNSSDVHEHASIDKKLSVSINKDWTKDNVLFYNRIIYAYNNVGVFTTVLTETNEPRNSAASAVINPLDTMPRKNKYSGDYIKGKRSFVSIRDGAAPGKYLFFVHFDNEKEESCGGELKGEMTMTGERTGTYNDNGDPCVIDFAFTDKQVMVKEQGSCGNYRGIKCFFNDTYTKKKEVKPFMKSTAK